MDACDVLLTKPGGLSSTEALAKGVAIVHTTPIPGCETENVQFFTEHHLSVCAKEASDAGRLAIAVMNDKFLQNQLLAAQKNYRCLNSAETIAKYVMSAS
jgi:processive 1,2-diacylglycerol beta-glucosyltransferase